MSEPQPTKCLRCGSTRLEGGRVFGGGFASPTLFFTSNERAKRFWPTWSKLRARACLDCGHIELLLSERAVQPLPANRTGTIDDILRRR